ncbi:HAD-IA family hydrolase [Ancylobacter vacuolatus]|uniref:Hydrolase of the HAD superfamily n=1 Tax=Ancylobacter vacuolatus TaxID=223389 RepID=A0ABU0DHR3_9HYPH|nr:HAD-IA family hydrolase [Ancylobacter vacuolatus]MDQ0347970.1 putative hydrolase of the HAD superfamily [Ancylobacter vacuolatus]
MNLSDFKILTFDVVGTLIDFEAGILEYVRPIAQRAGVQLDDEVILLSYGKAEGFEHDRTPGLPFPLMMAPAYQAMAAELGLPADKATVEGFRESIPAWPAFPDTVDALKRLRKRYRIVAMTNSDNWALGHFMQTMQQPFDDTVTAEDVGTCKPDPQFFAYTRGRQSPQGYKLEDYLHVAQSQYHDIGVARQLGYRTAWIERRMGKRGFGGSPAPSVVTRPDFHYASLVELADAVDREG